MSKSTKLFRNLKKIMITKNKIFEILSILKDEFGEDNIMLIGSTVFLLNDLDLGREYNDVDVLVKSSMRGVISRKINDIKVNIHFSIFFNKEYTLIDDYKVSTIDDVIKFKESVKSIKNINDLKYVKQNHNI